MQETCHLTDEPAMLAYGAQLAARLQPGKTCFLSGPLGAGKTTLVRGFLRQLGVRGPIRSPSFTLVEVYPFDDYDVFHFDFYRLDSKEQALALGLGDYFMPEAICLVEWPERCAAYLPVSDYHCHIAFAEKSGRDMTLEHRA